MAADLGAGEDLDDLGREVTGPYVKEIIAEIQRVSGGGNPDFMVVSQETWRYWEEQVTQRHNQEVP